MNASLSDMKEIFIKVKLKTLGFSMFFVLAVFYSRKDFLSKKQRRIFYNNITEDLKIASL
jgi:hypothetical protein